MNTIEIKLTIIKCVRRKIKTGQKRQVIYTETLAKLRQYYNFFFSQM